MSAALRESFSVATLDGDDIVYIARTTVNRVMAVDLHIGSRLPAYCTSMGRILLAYLSPEQQEAYLTRVALVPHTTRTVTSVESSACCCVTFAATVTLSAIRSTRSDSVPRRPRLRSQRTCRSHHQPQRQRTRISALEMQTRFLPHLRNAATELAVFLR